jgi:hypothetical protein
MRAVSKVLQRSERQALEKLLDTYVDVGILPQLENTNNQIVYGRRGTGKTHVLKVLASELQEDPAHAVVYVDARTLGSTSQFSNHDLPVPQRCTALFRDILGEMHANLLEYIVERVPPEQTQVLDLLDDFGHVVTDGVSTEKPTAAAQRQTKQESSKSSLGGSIAPAEIAGHVGLEAADSVSRSDEKEYEFDYQDKVVFPAVKQSLGAVLKALGSQLYIVIDEWSSIPFELQPYLAEFIKRAFIPDPKITTKIASLEYRSNFGVRKERDFLGFELGSDITTALDIDDYFVYDRSPVSVTNAFADMLFLHIRAEMPDDHLRAALKISSGESLASKMFTERRTFEELVRASEGVARDLINIFTTAFFEAQRRGRDSIDRKAVVEAARGWFEKDKAQNLEPELQGVLRRIVDDVIGHRKARSFLVPSELEKHHTLRRLFDSRVLHLMQRGYADKDNPGRRYNIYTLDYGTYVDLINTKKEPQIEMVEIEDNIEEEVVVPFDDKRSIRRITISEEILEVGSAGVGSPETA